MTIRDDPPSWDADKPRPSGSNTSSFITLGVVTGPQGLRGEVRIRPFTDDPKGLERYKTLMAGNRTLTVSKIRVQPNGVIARFEEVTDRNAAEHLRGVELTIPREALPPLEEDEFYQIDLIGLTALTLEGEVIGEVLAIPNYGSTDLLEIRTPAGKTHLVPFINDAVPNVRQDEGRITINPDFLP